MPVAVERLVAKPRLLFRPDPVLGWSLSPGHGVAVGFRDGVVQHVGDDGWRVVPGSGDAAGPRIAVYGCSFTYGTGLADHETFVAGLQAGRPEMRLLNRGIGGHGTVQNFLQFRRDLAAGAVDAALFAVISDHRFRNIPHPQRMRQYLTRDWYRLGVERVPVLRQDQQGGACIAYVDIWQPALERAEFDEFLPDEHMINGAFFATMRAVQAAARDRALPVRIAILDQLDPDFTAAVQREIPGTVDVSVPHDADHTFVPDDVHPNVAANRVFAERLLPVIDDLTIDLRSGDT